MAAFFSLGTPGTSGSHPQNSADENNNNNSGVFLYRSNPTEDQIYGPQSSKGLEIWQQYVQVHHHHHAPKLHVHQDHHHHHHHHISAVDEWRSSSSFSLSGFRGGERGGMNCQDCGNQAKKDCAHLRCRTCCKSRGFDCATHVKSTWVPAAKRRERQQQQLGSGAAGPSPPPEMMREKRMRESRANNAATSLACTTTTTNAPSTGLEVGNFPAEVNSPALFRCVKVSAIDDPDEQFAYQTAVNIGGHLFKGILYDQGPETQYGETSSGDGGTTHQHNLMLTSGDTMQAGGGGAPVTASLLDPSAIYPTPINAFMAEMV